MAILNTKEKLIKKAATSHDHFLNSVYKKFFLHFKAEGYAGKKIYDDCKFIDYLYCQNHKSKTFVNIANDIFHISVSTLEDRRAHYVEIFYFYLANEQSQNEVAITR